METKTIISISREAASLAAITKLQEAVSFAMAADGKEAATIQTCAKVLATQVSGLVLPLSSKVALVRATYADEFAQLAATKDLTKEQAKRKSNAVAGLMAAITCYCAADMPVEVKAPTDGKDAEFKKAGELSLSAMRANVAELKNTVKAEEQKAATLAALATMTPEQKAAEQIKADKAAADKAAAIEAQNKAAAKDDDARIVAEVSKRISSILQDSDNKAALEAAFLTVGLTLTKSKAAPKVSGSMADQIATLVK